MISPYMKWQNEGINMSLALTILICVGIYIYIYTYIFGYRLTEFSSFRLRLLISLQMNIFSTEN